MTRFEQARRLLDAERYSEIVELLEGTDDLGEMTLLGGACLYLGQAERAVGLFRRVVLSDPTYLYARKWLTQAYYWAGNFDAAESECQTVLGQEEDCGTRKLLAWIQAKTSGPSGLGPYVQKVESCGKDPAEPILIRAEGFLTMFRYRRAADILRPLLALRGIDPRVNVLLAKIAIGQRRYGDALGDLLELISSQPSTSQYLAGWACYRAGNFAAAVRWYRELQRNPHQRPWGLAGEARTLLALGRNEEAMQRISDAVRDFPNYRDLVLVQWLALWKTGHRKAAVRVVWRDFAQIFEKHKAKPKPGSASGTRA